MTGKLVTTDVLVIGGGLAGERCAIEAAAAGHEVLILSLVPPRRSHSCAAQGGMQAALGNNVKAAGDNPTVHFLDTVRGSDWGADQEVANIFADEAPIAVRELAHYGVPWTRVRGGRNKYFIKGEEVEIDEAIENDGLITHRDFGFVATAPLSERNEKFPDVATREDGFDAFNGFGPVSPNAVNPGMREGAPKEAPVKHSRKMKIRSVGGLAGRLDVGV